MTARAMSKASDAGTVQRREVKRTGDWSQAEVDYVTSNLAAGYSYGAIAEGLGRSRSAVAGMIRRLRGETEPHRIRPSRARTVKRVDEVAEMLSEGLSLTDIAARLGVPRDTVKCAFKRIKRRLGAQAV